MITWRDISDWADKRDKALAERKKAALKPVVPTLTYAGFHNGLSSLFGDICRITDKHTSDLAVCVHNFFEDTKDFVDRVSQNATNFLAGVIQEHAKIVCRYVQQVSLDMTDRFVQLMGQQVYHFDVLQGTQIGLYSNLTEQNQGLALKLQQIHHVLLQQQRTNNAPSLEWLADNAEELIRLGQALYIVRENSAPPDQARLNLIKTIRALTEFSITDIDEQIYTPVARGWGIL